MVSVWRGFLFLWLLGIGDEILLWHSLSLQLIILNYFVVCLYVSGSGTINSVGEERANLSAVVYL